jgi:hypothetical protein
VALTQTGGLLRRKVGWRIPKALFVQCKQHARGRLSDSNYVLTIHSCVSDQRRCACRGSDPDSPRIVHSTATKGPQKFLRLDSMGFSFDGWTINRDKSS